MIDYVDWARSWYSVEKPTHPFEIEAPLIVAVAGALALSGDIAFVTSPTFDLKPLRSLNVQGTTKI